MLAYIAVSLVFSVRICGGKLFAACVYSQVFRSEVARTAYVA